MVTRTVRHPTTIVTAQKTFLQVSTQAVVVTQPVDVVRQGGDDAEYNAVVTGDATIIYQMAVQ